MSASRDERSGPSYSSVPLDEEKALEPGAIVAAGRFVVREEIGSGGVGIVYRVEDRHDVGRSVALKVVRARHVGATIEARYRNEARLGANIDGHPSFVRALAVGTLDGPDDFVGRAYLATEYIEGRPLDELISNHAAGIPAARAVAIALDVARALAHLHARGIVHRDIKPSNVLLIAGPQPGTEHVKVIDFGLAYCTGDKWEAKSPDLTQDGKAPGTLLYMAPEQLAHSRPAPAFDVYAFGVMVYEMLSGGAPNEGLPVGELYARKCDPNGRVYPLTKMCAELPVELTSAVDRCLSFDPGQRPLVVDLVDLLERVGREMGSSASVIPLHPAAEVAGAESPASDEGAGDEARIHGKPAPSRKFVVPVFLVGLFVAAGTGAWLWSGSSRSDAPRARPVAEQHEAESPEKSVNSDKTESPEASESRERAEEPSDAADAGASLDGSEPQPSTPPPSTTDPESKQPHPDASETGTPSPRHSPPGQTDSSPAPSSPGPARNTAKPPSCDAHRTAALQAKKERKWATVLTHTRDESCWTNDTGRRAQLRVEALLELGRHRACLREASGSTDPKIADWRLQCIRAARSDGDHE